MLNYKNIVAYTYTLHLAYGWGTAVFIVFTISDLCEIILLSTCISYYHIIRRRTYTIAHDSRRPFAQVSACPAYKSLLLQSMYNIKSFDYYIILYFNVPYCSYDGIVRINNVQNLMI